MRLYRLERHQRLPISLQTAWTFFSDPENLSRITPSWLDFKTTTPKAEKMYPGMIVAYSIRPFTGIRASWVTEITHVRAPYYFVDEQRIGPYRFWHHQHWFEEIESGIAMQDLVHYVLPYGVFGSLLHHVVIKQKLEDIFEYRRDAVQRIVCEQGRDPISGTNT